MKRFFARNTVLAQQQSQQDLSRKALAGLTGNHNARFFASSPQANPYNSILTKLSVGSNQFSYYKLPALGDKRIGKYLPQQSQEKKSAWAYLVALEAEKSDDASRSSECKTLVI